MTLLWRTLRTSSRFCSTARAMPDPRIFHAIRKLPISAHGKPEPDTPKRTLGDFSFMTSSQVRCCCIALSFLR